MSEVQWLPQNQTVSSEDPEKGFLVTQNVAWSSPQKFWTRMAGSFVWKNYVPWRSWWCVFKKVGEIFGRDEECEIPFDLKENFKDE